MMKLTLKAARVNAGLSQEYLSKELGVSAPTLCNWENGKQKIPADIFLKICDICEVESKNIILPSR